MKSSLSLNSHQFNQRLSKYESPESQEFLSPKDQIKRNKTTQSGRAQIKSQATLPSRSYFEGTPSKSNIPSCSNMQQLKRLDVFNKSLLRKRNFMGKNLRQNSQLPNSPVKIDDQKISKAYIEELQIENMKLRQKLIDYDLRERDQIQKVNRIQKVCLILQGMLQNKKAMTYQEDQFLSILKTTFKDCFGITGYKNIWAKQKEIMRDWMHIKMNQMSLQTEGKGSNIQKSSKQPRYFVTLPAEDQQIQINIKAKQRKQKIKGKAIKLSRDILKYRPQPLIKY